MRHEWIAIIHLCVIATFISGSTCYVYESNNASNKTVATDAEDSADAYLLNEANTQATQHFDPIISSSPAPDYVNTSQSSTRPPTRYFCNIADDNYDCKIRGVQLFQTSSVYFGSDNSQQRITFIDSFLHYLPKSLIDAYPNATLLNLDMLKIHNIEQRAFESAQNLEELYLQNNGLKKITHDTFHGAISLSILQLSNNQLLDIEENAFVVTTSLQLLHLDSNRLFKLPSFTKNKRLRYLNASQNNVDNISDSHFSANNDLEILDLSFNKIEVFDMEQLNMKYKLEYVSVSYNMLTELSVPYYVKKLNAKNNSIEEVTIARCSLTELDLSSNKIRNMPSISKCNQLNILDLSYNLLEFAVFAFPPTLKHLYLSNNHLFKIEIRSKANLRPHTLDISNNYLSHIPKTEMFNELVKLALHNNKFIEFDFPNKGKLVHTTLQKNEWNCKAIETVLDFAIDRSETICADGFQSDNGICCRNYTRPYNDRLNQLIRDAFFAEFSNEERIKSQCKASQLGFESPQISQQELDNLRNEAARADSSTKDLLQSLASVKQERQRITEEVQQITTNAMSLNSTKKQLDAEIDRQRDIYHVPKEGLETSWVILVKVLDFVKSRNAFNQESVSKWAEDLERANTQYKELEAKKLEMEGKLAQYKDAERQLKGEEKVLKLKHDKLQASLNKNAPSLSG